MKKYFIDYLNSMRVTDILKQRINEIYKFYNFTCPEEIMEIFISDYFKKDGERVYSRICFFSESFYMETYDFETNDNFYITPLKNRIVSVSIEKEYYNFKKATEKSKLGLSFRFSEEEKHLSAGKSNCDYLRNIIIKYFLQNLQLYQEPRSISTEDIGLGLQKDLEFVIGKKELRKKIDIKEILKRHGYKKKRTKKLSNKIGGG